VCVCCVRVCVPSAQPGERRTACGWQRVTTSTSSTVILQAKPLEVCVYIACAQARTSPQPHCACVKCMLSSLYARAYVLYLFARAVCVTLSLPCLLVPLTHFAPINATSCRPVPRQPRSRRSAWAGGAGGGRRWCRSQGRGHGCTQSGVKRRHGNQKVHNPIYKREYATARGAC